MEYQIRTDLALEEKERFAGTNVEIRGVSVEESRSDNGNFSIMKVRILNEEGARVMKKPIGNYITFEHCEVHLGCEDEMEQIAEELGEQLKEIIADLQNRNCMKKKKEPKCLIVGLGNREATPDALGPETASKIVPQKNVYVVSPGVMAQTGLETSAYIHGIAKEVNADFIVTIDSLAARNATRLTKTVQIADTGIHPGSGVGNNRQAINVETMGIPVIAIGVPTVVDAATIVSDVMDNLIGALEDSVNGLSKVMAGFSAYEKKQLARELMQPEVCDLYVTPKDIDENIVAWAEIISKAFTCTF